MQYSTKTRRIFRFDSGTHIEVFRHLGYDSWGASWEKNSGIPSWEFTSFSGYGKTKLLAVKELRANIARRITKRILGEI